MFIMYIQLILSFTKKFIQNECKHLQVHTPNDLPDAGSNIMGAHSNIECIM